MPRPANLCGSARRSACFGTKRSQVQILSPRPKPGQKHGPFHEFDGRASGFSHDELGAALAATHIGPRITAAAGTPAVEATLVQQCWRDVTATRERLATTLPRPDTAARDDPTPIAMYFRVIAGDAGGDHVVVSLLAARPSRFLHVETPNRSCMIIDFTHSIRLSCIRTVAPVTLGRWPPAVGNSTDRWAASR